MLVGVKPGQWGWSFKELVPSWQEAEEAGFGLLACFDTLQARRGRRLHGTRRPSLPRWPL